MRWDFVFRNYKENYPKANIKLEFKSRWLIKYEFTDLSEGLAEGDLKKK